MLTAGYHLLCKGDGAAGISAMPPAEYAERFETFVLHEVLQLPLPLSEEQAAAAAGLPRRRASSGSDRSTLERGRRWGELWQRRRRGLIKVRIDAECADHMRRIGELEAQVAALTAAAPNGESRA